MEFIEGSTGIYRPIRVLFDSPIYERALQINWNMNSYQCQIALMRELLSLQQKKQIPSQVTAEDMINLIVERSKKSLREQLWEFELEGFDEDAKPLLTLLWAVNVSNKMRDVAFEAQLLLNSPEATPPNFQNPNVFSVAEDYAKILRQKAQEAPCSKAFSPEEVVLEVVPKVLQGLWVLSPRPLLNMRSQKLSIMSVGVTKATLDRVSEALTSVKHHATFSRSIRDDMVMSILTNIRETNPYDVLVKRSKSFAPVLLSQIVDLAVGQICGVFQPRSPKVPGHLAPAVEPPANTPVQEDFNLAVTEEPHTPSPQTHPAEVSPPPVYPTPLVEPPSIDVQAREDENLEPTVQPDSAVTLAPLTPPAEPVIIAAVLDNLTTSLDQTEQPVSSPETNPAEVCPPPSPPTSPTETPCSTDVQDREDVNEKPILEDGPKPTREPASAAVPASPPPLSEDNMKKKKGKQGFFRRLLRRLCCCCLHIRAREVSSRFV